MMRAAELRKALTPLGHKELVDLVVKLYRCGPDARREIELCIGGESYAEERRAELQRHIDSLGYYPAGTLKGQMADYFKVEKDKGRRIEAVFALCDAAVEGYGRKRCDARMVMVASSFFGKAMDMMDAALWERFGDRSYELAGGFYELPLEAGLQAAGYYREAARRFAKHD